MARKSTKGTTQLGAEVSAELAAHMREFARSRGETLREVIEMALRRHMANPPPRIDPPPLPPIVPLPPFPPPAVKKGGKK